MITPVVLGVDLAKRSLGLALVELEEPCRPLWADTISIDQDHKGWRDEQVANALGDISMLRRYSRLTTDCSQCSGKGSYWQNDGHGRQERVSCGPCYGGGKKREPCQDAEVSRVAIEQPPYVNNRRVYRDLVEISAFVQSAAHKRWPWATQIMLEPATWKKATVGKGNAKKDEVRHWVEHGWGAIKGEDENGNLVADHNWPGLFGGNHTLYDDLYPIPQDAADAIAIAVAGARAELLEAAA